MITKECPDIQFHLMSRCNVFWSPILKYTFTPLSKYQEHKSLTVVDFAKSNMQTCLMSALINIRKLP